MKDVHFPGLLSLCQGAYFQTARQTLAMPQKFLHIIPSINPKLLKYQILITSLRAVSETKLFYVILIPNMMMQYCDNNSQVYINNFFHQRFSKHSAYCHQILNV